MSPAPGSGRITAPQSARRIALDVLDRVLGELRPLEDTFNGHPGLALLAPRDRAFARLLVTTTLRRLGQIDALLGELLRETPKPVRVRNLLRLGAAQLLFQGTPAHAAVGESVALATGRHAYAKPLANAVLRRLAEEGAARLAAQDAARLNTPDWLWQSWCAAEGEARTRAIAEAHLVEPPLDITVKAEPEIWAQRLGAERLFGNTLRRAAGGPIEDLPGYAEGAWWIQDVAAALPALLLLNLGHGEIVDLCAAPGGKTAQLAAVGAKIVAVEVSERRTQRLRANLERLRLTAELVIADALEWRPARPVPAALLDAPCTATGTIRRHPDIAWHKTAADVVRMAELQGRLLANAGAMLQPGGALVYASCSLQPEEGLEVVGRALARDLSLERLPVRPEEIQGLPVEITAEGDVRTLPCHLAGRGGMDGFFIARLRRRG
ncbi:MAG: RsmB/NOP family class I SAM-dependent RNA methyltransferase [Geminicoccaceae bacterium]